jgi:hypothetical protein
MTSSAKAADRVGNQDFVYVAATMSIDAGPAKCGRLRGLLRTHITIRS